MGEPQLKVGMCFAVNALHEVRLYYILDLMLNFASLFNQFRSQSSGGVTELLDQPALKMGRLLDEDAFLNDYKSGNSPRIQEFMKYERYQELVEFVTVVGPADDKKRGYKYPLAACDLLCVDTPSALDFLFPDQPITLNQTVFDEVEEEVEEKIEEELLPATAIPEDKNKEQSPQQIPPVSQPEQKTPHAVQQQVEKPKEEAQPSPKQEARLNSQEKEEPSQSKPSEEAVKADPPKEQAQPFPAEKYRKVKVVRKVERVVSRVLQPLVDKLMDYFSGEVNYTLAGYVSKILSFLSNKKPLNFLQYFLQQKFVASVLNHAQSRSVGELITKVLTSEAQGGWAERKSFFLAMLGRLSAGSDVHIMSNLSACVTEVMEKAAANLKSVNRVNEFAEVFFSLEVMVQVIKNVMSEEESVSVYNAPVLLTFLTNVPFTLPEAEATKQEFTELIRLFVQSATHKLNVRAMNHPKIGLGRTKIIEILRFVIKEDILGAKQIVADSADFFPILLSLLREYPLANLLHNEVVKVIELALADPQLSPLNTAILRENVLLEFIREQVQEDDKIRAGQSVYKSRKGFIAHLINLAAKLKELAPSNSAIRTCIESPQYELVYQSFFEKEIFNSKKSLAGFLVKRDNKQHEIQFQKEDIIAAYATFLRKCPPPVFEEVPPSADSHPDLIEELQKQIQETLTIKPKEEKKADSPKAAQKKNQPVVPSEPEQPRFWESILGYDLDELPLDW